MLHCASPFSISSASFSSFQNSASKLFRGSGRLVAIEVFVRQELVAELRAVLPADYRLGDFPFQERLDVLAVRDVFVVRVTPVVPIPQRISSASANAALNLGHYAEVQPLTDRDDSLKHTHTLSDGSTQLITTYHTDHGDRNGFGRGVGLKFAFQGNAPVLGITSDTAWHSDYDADDKMWDRGTTSPMFTLYEIDNPASLYEKLKKRSRMPLQIICADCFLGPQEQQLPLVQSHTTRRSLGNFSQRSSTRLSTVTPSMMRSSRLARNLRCIPVRQRAIFMLDRTQARARRKLNVGSIGCYLKTLSPRSHQEGEIVWQMNLARESVKGQKCWSCMWEALSERNSGIGGSTRPILELAVCSWRLTL